MTPILDEQRHPLARRIAHWIVALSILLMIGSGWRIYNASPLRDWRNLGDVGLQAGFGNPVLRTGNLKSFADGALGSATAWMNAPFADQPDKSGLASTDLMDAAAMYAKAAAQGDKRAKEGLLRLENQP